MTAASLFGWPAPAHAIEDAVIEVVGVPSDAGNGIAAGARFAPTAIRRASMALRPDACGVDHGDIGNVHGCDWERVLENVEQTVNAIIRRTSLPIILGGDHAISYAGVAAACDCRPLNIVWFDAHTDFCAWENQSWHNHKQVLRRIAGLDHVGRIIQIGHRGITYVDEADRFERLTVITATRALNLPPAMILDHLPVDEPIYLSIDIDVLDPRCAPGTGHPVPGGLSVAQVSEVARAIASNRHIVAADVMEVNPLLDHQDMTSTAAATILSELVTTIARADRLRRPDRGPRSARAARVS
ncbi:MAG: arginase family protein [Pseudomonadota bacterium]|nr:arginase family protein [Pseudomonadota bacterium]